MAMKDYNSINFKNSAIDKMSGKFGKGDEPTSNKAAKENEKRKMGTYKGKGLDHEEPVDRAKIYKDYKSVKIKTK
jgi:hypothetical protein